MVSRPAWSDELRGWVYREAAGLIASGGTAPSAARIFGGHAFPCTRRAAAALVRAVAAHDARALEAERVRLFLNGPGGPAAPPYASFYLDGELCGASLAWAEAQYAACGLDAAGGEPGDFAATELEFLYVLSRHLDAALLTGDTPALTAALDLQASFFHDHLRLWLPRFVDRLRAAEPSEPFSRLADLLDVFCDEEAAALAAVPLDDGRFGRSGG